MSNNERPLRDHLSRVLNWGDAHMQFDDVVKDFPPELRGKRPAGAPHSPWELLEHLRIAFSDILEYTRVPNHVSPEFPEGYWPSSPEPPNAKAWDDSVAAHRRAIREFAALAADDSVDLYARVPNGETVLREILLGADHNAWHLGQLVMVRRMLGV